MKLFAVYIGGELKGANIELHDMRFVLAESIEGTYEELKRQWWGIPSSLHLDCWSHLTHADGYSITLKDYPSSDPNKLFYVNLGGYDPNQFTEMHKNMFVVAETESKAKMRALKTVSDWDASHKDNVMQAEQAVSIPQVLAGQQWYIHLEKIAGDQSSPFTCRYTHIGKDEN